MGETKYPELKGLLDRNLLQLSENAGRLEATLELAGISGLNTKLVSMIHNSSRAIYSCTNTNLIWGGQVSGEMYAKVIGLLKRAEKLLGDDVHAGYERERILDLVSMAKARRPELNDYLSGSEVDA